jgi:DNA-binding NarL/FixJ family response regulator
VVDKQRLDAERSASEVPGGISRREWDVAQLVAQGKSNRAIAEALVLSERTVENHIASIFNKRSLRSRAEIASFVAREERLPLAK